MPKTMTPSSGSAEADRGHLADSCQRCGACCASFRVSFYWAEAEVLGIPQHDVEQLTPSMACLAGTNQAAPHCGALEGRVGEAVNCRIYASRPSPCREVQRGDAQCRRARLRHGLPPLEGEHEQGETE